MHAQPIQLPKSKLDFNMPTTSNFLSTYWRDQLLKLSERRPKDWLKFGTYAKDALIDSLFVIQIPNPNNILSISTKL